VQFPKIPSLSFASYMPSVWRMDFGADYATTKVITREPPLLGAAFPVLVPQVNADGNDVGGIALPEVAVPLGTHTGWNVSTYPLSGLRYLAGLVGSFQPFPKTRAEREQSNDSRLSIEERYKNRQDYLQRVKDAAANLVRERFVLETDVEALVQQADRTWSVIVGQ
jgi:hypothetical protein